MQAQPLRMRFLKPNNAMQWYLERIGTMRCHSNPKSARTYASAASALCMSQQKYMTTERATLRLSKDVHLGVQFTDCKANDPSQ
jgi:hypothetical protein